MPPLIVASVTFRDLPPQIRCTDNENSYSPIEASAWRRESIESRN
jgi:hypothetical protein